MVMNSQKIKNFIRNALFYEKWTCNICGAEIFSGIFCDNCNKKISHIKENRCEHCGRITYAKVPFCDSCKTQNLNFDKARSLYEYKEPISYLIQNFKYDNCRYLARIFAGELYSLYQEEGFELDVITFVPMHEERLVKRGYNQSQLLAEELSNLVGAPLINALTKTVETERQANLNLQERRKNLKGSFKADKKQVKDKSVLLVDDVLTTGSTVDVISELLKKAGAKSVYVLTIASVQKDYK